MKLSVRLSGIAVEMVSLRKTPYLVLLLSGLTTLVQAAAQTPVQLSPIRQIHRGVDAWPLILNPKNDMQRSINKSLTDLNAKLSQSLRRCHANYIRQMGNQPRSTDNNDEGMGFWKQKIKVTMSGPAFLSLVATTDFDCGGAHPYGYTDAAVFDLRTGEPANPIAWLAPSLRASLVEEDNPDHSLERSVSAARLLEAYREARHHECDQTYSDNQPFLIWPDAYSATVVIEADRLPGCCEACGVETGLALEQAREIGFSEAFLQAISQGHKRLAHR